MATMKAARWHAAKDIHNVRGHHWNIIQFDELAKCIRTPGYMPNLQFFAYRKEIRVNTSS